MSSFVSWFNSKERAASDDAFDLAKEAWNASQEQSMKEAFTILDEWTWCVRCTDKLKKEIKKEFGVKDE